MTAKAYIYPSFPVDADGDYLPVTLESLYFLRDGNWWSPPKISGPRQAKVLFAQQMAVDFMYFIDHIDPFDEEVEAAASNPLSRVVAAMPEEHGVLETEFLRVIESFARTTARAMS